MLRHVKVPVLFTHHFNQIRPGEWSLMGAVSDLQVAEARKSIEAAGQPFTGHSFPGMGHSMHGQDPQLYATVLRTWLDDLTQPD